MRTASMLKRIARSSDRGQLIPVLALSLSLLMGVSALAIDVGYWRYQQRLEQSAADSAALAGAIELNYPSDPTAYNWSAAALKDAASNGFTDDGGVTVSVTPNNPPTLGPYAGNANAVEVILKEKQPQLFGAILGVTSQWVSVRAVALLSSANRGCIYGLSPGVDDVTISGSNVAVPYCGIISDGNLNITGSVITAGVVDYAGTCDSPCALSQYTKALPEKSVPAADPCSSVPGCAYLTANPPSSGPCLSTNFGSTPVTIPPGRYCSFLDVKGINTTIFAPGVYEFDQGLNVQGANSVTGAGVTFYIGSGPLSIQGATVSLSAPSSPNNTAGVLIYQNASDTNSPSFQGTSTTLAGMVYFPGANLSIAGASISNPNSMVVAKTVTLSGAWAMSSTVSAYPGFSHPVLGE